MRGKGQNGSAAPQRKLVHRIKSYWALSKAREMRIEIQICFGMSFYQVNIHYVTLPM